MPTVGDVISYIQDQTYKDAIPSTRDVRKHFNISYVQTIRLLRNSLDSGLIARKTVHRMSYWAYAPALEPKSVSWYEKIIRKIMLGFRWIKKNF